MQLDYYRQIQQAADLIEEHLNRELGIRDIAAAAGFSPFHFQRLFQAISGFTVKEYIRKRRLSEAARLLAETDDSILDIALASGYESQEAFTRAFEGYTGLAPGKFRKDKSPLTALRPIRFLDLPNRVQPDLDIGRPNIVTLERRIIIGREYPTTLEEGRHYREIPGFYGEFGSQQRFRDIPCRLEPDMAYGVSTHFRDDGGFGFIVGERTESSALPPDSRYIKTELPAGKYAEFKAYGPGDHVQKIREFIYGTWLPASNYSRTDGPDFEVTDVLRSQYPVRMKIKIFIPLS